MDISEMKTKSVSKDVVFLISRISNKSEMQKDFSILLFRNIWRIDW